MADSEQLNGVDYLMRGFDRELRRNGFAGNSCQIVLELGAPVSAAKLQERVDALVAAYPCLCARPGGLFPPRWCLPEPTATSPRVRVWRDEPGLRQKLFNVPLDVDAGELIRFELVQRDDGKMDVVFTWAHALMDAPGAEYLLALTGTEALPMPAMRFSMNGCRRISILERLRIARKNLSQFDGDLHEKPRPLGVRHAGAPRQLKFRVVKFSNAEAACIRENAARHCGLLGKTLFHMAVAMAELHRMRIRLGRPSPSYILPVSIGLRQKGSINPLFGNQVGMLILQFLPEQLETVRATAAYLKGRVETSMRGGFIDGGRVLSDLTRLLPLPLFMACVKRHMGGETCSLFFGDTACVNPYLGEFLGVPVEDMMHAAAVTPLPGMGVVFSYFRDELRLTVIHSPAVLDDDEAAAFAAGIRARLLQPEDEDAK